MPCDTEAARQAGVGVDVDLSDEKATRVLLRKLRDHWRHGVTGTAPRSPEVDQHGRLGAAHDLVEACFRQFNWMRHVLSLPPAG